jgi:xanthine dehydrogenase accessory factor
MISRALSSRAQELRARREPFVTATVVRAQAPTSAEAGNVALVHRDGTIEGFIGGVCAEHSVRLYSLKAIERGEPLLLRIMPDGPGRLEPVAQDAGHELAREDGSVTVQNPCLSGGEIEVFIEPVMPTPRVLVAGETPIAAALLRLGVELGLEMVQTQGGQAGMPHPAADDLALIVAAHGRDELAILRSGVEAGVRYVGLVASRTRGAAVIDELRGDGVDEGLLATIESPAGLDIGARTPSEIAVAILAQLVAVRRARDTEERVHQARAAAAPVTVVDPVCGMTVVVVPGTPSLECDGELYYFCGEGCQRRFEAEHGLAAARG